MSSTSPLIWTVVQVSTGRRSVLKIEFLRHNIINPFTIRLRPGIPPGLPMAVVIFPDYRRQRQCIWTNFQSLGAADVLEVVRLPIRSHKTETPRYLGTHRTSWKPSIQVEAVCLDSILPPVPTGG